MLLSSEEKIMGIPQYQCHKKVHALKIRAIERNMPFATGSASGAKIIPEEEGLAVVEVNEDYLRKHKPQAGGYYVLYDNDYESFSPGDVFEAGYTRI